MDLVIGDHGYLVFYESDSHRLRYATTTNHSCFGGFDTIDLGPGDVRVFLNFQFLPLPFLKITKFILLHAGPGIRRGLFRQHHWRSWPR